MSPLFQWPPPWSTVLLLPALLVGFTVHELAHALVAFWLGDTSQVERQRLSFNPLRHVSWFGMLAFLVVGLGWAKPVWVDPARFRTRNRALGLLLVSLAGVSANLLTALLALLGMSATIAAAWLLKGAEWVTVFRYLASPDVTLDAHGLVVALSYYMLSVNLILALFNLIPLPPLDGFNVLASLFNLIAGAVRRGPAAAPAPQALPAPAPQVSPPAPAGEEAAAPATAGPDVRTPAQIHLEIGLAYHKQGQLDEAIARYRQAIAHDAGLALAYYNLGQAYRGKGRTGLAASAFRAASQPGAEPGLRSLAELRLRELERGAPAAGGQAPAPLEPGRVPQAAAPTAAPLDPALARRVWLRLALGAGGLLLLALAAWLYVTLVTLAWVQ